MNISCRHLSACLLILASLLTACSLNGKLTDFRQQHEAALHAGQLTQSWVVGHLGMPHATVVRGNGTIWGYRYQEYSAMQRVGLGFEAFGAGYNGQPPMYSYAPATPDECAEYLLFFDTREILRQWHQRTC